VERFKVNRVEFMIMSRTLTLIAILLSILVSIVLLGGLVWTNTLFVQNHPLEKDFLVPWLGARTLLQYGDNPYGDAATQRAQIVYYGRLAVEGEDPLLLSVAFPLELFYFPFALIPNYPLARGFWMTLIEIALVALGLTSLRLTGWRPVSSLLPVLLLFSVFWVYGFTAILKGGAVVFIALAVVGSLLAIQTHQDELAGALLVIPLFKMGITTGFMVFILWWMFYHRRWRILAGILMALIVLLGLTFLFLPNWFFPFVRGVIAHFIYQPGLTPGQMLGTWWPSVGPRLGWMLTGIGLVALLLEWRATRGDDPRQFILTACLTLAITPLLGIPYSAQDVLLLFIPLIMFLTILGERWHRLKGWGISGITLIILFFLSWLQPAIKYLGGNTKSWEGLVPMIFPILLTIGLYWMRWWAIHTPRTWSDSLS